MAEAPPGKGPKSHTTTPLVCPHAPRVLVAETNPAPGGSASRIFAPLAGSAPLFVARMVYVTLAPAEIAAGEPVIPTDKLTGDATRPHQVPQRSIPLTGAEANSWMVQKSRSFAGSTTVELQSPHRTIGPSATFQLPSPAFNTVSSRRLPGPSSEP